MVKIYGWAADFTLTWLFWGQCPSLLLIAHGEYIHFTCQQMLFFCIHRMNFTLFAGLVGFSQGSVIKHALKLIHCTATWTVF